MNGEVRIKKGRVGFAALLLIGGLVLGWRWAADNNHIPGMQSVQSSVPEDGSLREYRSDAPGGVRNVSTNAGFTAASTEVSDKEMPTMRVKAWAWNGHMSVIHAVGGLETTRGSLAEKYGVRATFQREDDTNQLRDLLFACANELADSARDCRTGIHFTTLMGDQLGAQLAGWNEQFRKLGEDLTIEVIGFGGRSDGEDAFLAPPAVKLDPQNARGLVVAAAPREGDQNLVIFWAARNDIPINVNTRTYDPDAINFWDANSYTHAAELFNTKACEKRAEVKNTKRTGKSVNACVDSLTTWTPADWAATVGPNARGGVVRIFSTKENSSQMPNAILGIKRWNKNNFQTVVNFLAAVTEAGEQIRTNPAAQMRSAEASAAVYGAIKAAAEEEKDPRFWLRYYRGVKETDVQGNEVELGGWLAFTLADNLKYWGIPGGTDYFRDTYELFGGYMKKYYPNEVPVLEPYDSIANKTYMRAVMNMRREAATRQATGVVREFGRGEEITQVSARGAWSIEFDTGKDTFTSVSLRTLEELRRSLSVAQNELVQINGHTDDVGDPALNQDLSERRAQAVKSWLQSQSRETFPDNRLEVRGFGEDRPLAAGTTPEARARNRRVEIVLGR